MTSLTGQLLVSMPQMGDPYFARSVVYLCAHGIESGAMGLIVNKVIDSLNLDGLFAQLEIEPARQARQPQPVHFGGPVSTGNGFVLHSLDYRETETLAIDEEVAMTATLDILRAMARGEGPRKSLVALGYAGWGPGQLDAEIAANGWLVVAPDSGIIFDADEGSKWQRALAKLGISPEMLSGEMGRA